MLWSHVYCKKMHTIPVNYPAGEHKHNYDGRLYCRGAHTSYFLRNGGRVYPAHTHDHSAWSDIRSRRWPRAHTSTEAPSAQHHAMLRARCQLHSLLATVQCAVAAADHNCCKCNTAFHYTTQHTSELRRRIRRADTIASAHDSPRGAFRCSCPHCLPFCSAQRSPCCSACCEDCCTAAPSRRPSSSARLPSTVSSSNATCDAATSLPPTTCAPADRPQHQRLAPHYPASSPIVFGNCLRHLRVDHLPRHDFRARFQVRVPRLAPRAPCLLRPARQQTIYNINGLLTSLSTTPLTVFGICPAGSRAPGASAALALSAVPAGAVRHENTRNSRPLRLVNHRRRPCATITRLHCHV